MCLGVYGYVVDVSGDYAVVDFGGGLVKTVLLTVDGVSKGDYVVVHAGIVVSKLSREDFLETFQHLEKISKSLAEENPAEYSRIQPIAENVKKLLEISRD